MKKLRDILDSWGVSHYVTGPDRVVININQYSILETTVFQVISEVSKSVRIFHGTMEIIVKPEFHLNEKF